MKEIVQVADNKKGLFWFFFGCAPWFPVQVSNPRSLCWEHRVLTTGPSGKSLRKSFNLTVIKERPCKETVKYHLTYLVNQRFNTTANK